VKEEVTVEKEKAELASLFSAIGEFMFEFSQLEFIIRHALGDALALKEIGEDAQFDIVTSPYDFLALCKVTEAIFVRTMKCEEADKKEIAEILKQAMALNNECRVPIAHGTWFIDETGLGNRHVPRNKLEVSIKFSRIGEIQAASKRASEIKSRLIKFLIGPIKPKDEAVR
jgi:hypothetical protein